MDTRTKTGPPRLASDVTRSVLVGAITIVVTIGMPFALIILANIDDIGRVVASSLLTGWAVMGFGMSLTTWIVFRRADGEELRRWLAATTPKVRAQRVMWSINGGGGISWAITGSGIAVVAIVVIGANREFRGDALVVGPAIAVVAASIIMMISGYAVHYARENTRLGGLEFSDGARPVFVDYFYVAVQVATTFSTSDVVVTKSSMRRTVAVHSLTAFTFNTVVVALLVSMLIVIVS